MNLKERYSQIFNSLEESKEKWDRFVQEIGRIDASQEEVFNTLWTEAIKTQSANGMVYPCAYALHKLNITCPLNPKDAIGEMLKEWDVSIEEVPWYLVNQFSKETLIEIINEMGQLENDARLKAILYWIKNRPD